MCVTAALGLWESMNHSLYSLSVHVDVSANGECGLCVSKYSHSLFAFMYGMDAEMNVRDSEPSGPESNWYSLYSLSIQSEQFVCATT